MTDLIAYWHEGKEFISTPAELITELTFANYRFNRERNPEITPAQWGKIFPQVDRLEVRYQQEQEQHAPPLARRGGTT